MKSLASIYLFFIFKRQLASPFPFVVRSKRFDRKLPRTAEHGTINDFGWMKDPFREKQEVIDLIDLENNKTMDYFQDEFYSDSDVVSVKSTFHSFHEKLKSYYLFCDESDTGTDDFSVPLAIQSYYYYTRKFNDRKYKVYCRAPIPKDGKTNFSSSTKTTTSSSNNNVDLDYYLQNRLKTFSQFSRSKSYPVLPGEQIYFDPNKDLISPSGSNVTSDYYLAMGLVKPSPSQNRVAITVDFTGRELCDLFIKDISKSTRRENKDNGEFGHNTIHHYKSITDDHTDKKDTKFLDGQIEWANDTALYFVSCTYPEHRPYQIYMRRFSYTNTSTSYYNSSTYTDELLYQENDESKEVFIKKSQDSKFLFIYSLGKDSTKVQFLDLTSDDLITKIQSVPDVFHGGIQCKVEHYLGNFIFVTNLNPIQNKQEQHFRLMTCSSSSLQTSEKEFLRRLKPIHSCSDNYEKKERDTIFWDTPEKNDTQSIELCIPLRDHIVLYGREHGLPQLWILYCNNDKDKSSKDQILVSHIEQYKFKEHENSSVDECYTMSLLQNLDGQYCCHASSIILSYQSLITPPQTIQISLPISLSSYPKAEQLILKQSNANIDSSYNPGNYCTKRINVPVSKSSSLLYSAYPIDNSSTQNNDDNGDNEEIIHIPVSLMYKKDSSNDRVDDRTNNNNLYYHFIGYGSYGSSLEPIFQYDRIALLDSGVDMIALIHVRGGSELGTFKWYKDPVHGAVRMCKINSINDFTHVIKHFCLSPASTSFLMKQQQKKKRDRLKHNTIKISLEGYSAGGTLIASVLNQFSSQTSTSNDEGRKQVHIKAALLNYPFLDVLESMLDDTLPLTKVEYEEWGNPSASREVYDYIRSYSPLQNINMESFSSYPAIMLTAGYHDFRVPVSTFLFQYLLFPTTLLNSSFYDHNHITLYNNIVLGVTTICTKSS